MNDIREHAGPLVIAHFRKGLPNPIFHVIGANVRLLTIDERVTDPSDRVYEVTKRAHPRVLDELLSPDDPIATANHTPDENPLRPTASAPVPLPKQPAKRELPPYLRVIK